MNNKNILILLSTLTFLSACASERAAPKLDYQSENKKVLSLEVPPDLRDPRQGDMYSLPAGVTANPDALERADPQGNRVLVKVKNARLERSGNQRWLSVQDKQAAELWPLLRTFWQENGFTIHSEEPQVGVMETEWAENRAKLPHQGVRKLFDKVGLGSIYTTSERDKFIIRMELNKQNGYDIFFSHKGLEEVYDSKTQDRTVWQPRPNDPNLEAAFLARFMQYIGMDEKVIQQQTAQQADTQQGTEFAKREKDSVAVSGSAERNINRIGAALDRIGLTVQQFVAERGMFVVQPAPAESDVIRAANQKQGWFDRIRGKKPENIKPEQAPQMFVAIEQIDNGQRIHLLNQSGKPYQGADKGKLLDSLYRELR